MNSSRLEWYLRRLERMGPKEVLWRARDTALHEIWVKRQVSHDTAIERTARIPGPAIEATLPAGIADLVPSDASKELVAQADEILCGRMTLLGKERLDLSDPDWFFDPVTGRRAPSSEYAFHIAHRSEAVTGNIKQIWEVSRLHHLTILATAWKITGNDEYASAVDRQLRSWWKQNTFLSGVNWTSGIEIGIRLISFVWIRRLLDGWNGTTDLFEDNPMAIAQVRWHHEYLAKFTSRGSSSNNHVIAEAAGQLVASCAFRWFDKSDTWRNRAALLLERELDLNTFPSGVNRELASEYHWFVLELAIVAAVEADASGHRLSDQTWELITRMFDAGAALLDSALHHPRQGDGDDGKALVLDDFEINRAALLLSVGASVIGAASWWPESEATLTSTFLGSLAPDRSRKSRESQSRPSHFADAGITILRTRATERPEIWCRCDGGPHGYLSIAGHAHADALSVEVRHEGTEILVDPGTYCYHGEPEFRNYFRSTLGHNTIEIASTDQSVSGGPFMWLRHANTKTVEVEYADDGSSIRRWSAVHDGYESLDSPATHLRTVSIDTNSRRIDICDVVRSEGNHPARLLFHLGPTVDCELGNSSAELTWLGGAARLDLPREASWSSHTGDTNPMLGWYSSSFGVLEPTTVLVGEIQLQTPETKLETHLTFLDAGKSPLPTRDNLSP